MSNRMHLLHFKLLHYLPNSQMNQKVNQNGMMIWPQKHVLQIQLKGGIDHHHVDHI
jgi:hypothetical protein